MWSDVDLANQRAAFIRRWQGGCFGHLPHVRAAGRRSFCLFRLWPETELTNSSPHSCFCFCGSGVAVDV